MAKPDLSELDVILNIYYPPTDELKAIVEKSERNGGPFVPVNGGSGLKGDRWVREHVFFDDEGDDNISHLNPLMNEMTSVYWYWKNAMRGKDYVGFNHYRRFFSEEDLADYRDWDIIVSKPIWSSDSIPIATQYRTYHVLSDLQACVDVIREEYSHEWGEGFRKYLLTSGQNLAPCNMYVMKRWMFEEWCAFVFPIMMSLERKICHADEFLKRDNYQKRALCFLVERMFNYWYYLKRESGIRAKEVTIVDHLDFKPEGVNERGDFSRALPKVALVAIAKDEDDYLKEWVDYHLKVGFSDIFVYQNNWRYTRGDISDRRVHLEVLDGHRMQNLCYNEFIVKRHQDYDFAAFLDVDEFLWIRDGKSISEELDGYRDVDSIYLNWRLFGDNGLSSVTDGNYSVIDRFTRCDDRLHRLGKHIVNLKRTGTSVIFNNPHILQYADLHIREFKSLDPNRKRRCECGSLPDNTETEGMELFHFRNKTWEENVRRKYMTDDAFHEADGCDFRRDMSAIRREFDSHNRNVVVNTSLKEFCGLGGASEP